MKYLKHFLIVTVLAAGTVFASHVVWQGTDWIADGQLISASKTKDNFEYLYERVNEHEHENTSTVPSCAQGQTLVSNGSSWRCETVTSTTTVSCRIVRSEIRRIDRTSDGRYLIQRCSDGSETAFITERIDNGAGR